jgi:LAO/AO transport system kinase
VNEVRSILTLDRESPWRPPIVLTEAVREENVPELWERIEKHRAHLEEDDRLEERRRQNLAGEVFAVASSRAKAHLERTVEDDPELRRVLDAVERRELDPLTAVSEIIQKVFHLGDENGTQAR